LEEGHHKVEQILEKVVLMFNFTPRFDHTSQHNSPPLPITLDQISILADSAKLQMVNRGLYYHDDLLEAL
jgi:hypothetical protein